MYTYCDTEYVACTREALRKNHTDFSHPIRCDSGEEVAKSADVVGVKQSYDHDSCPAVHGVQVAVQLLVVVLKTRHRNRREGGHGRGVRPALVHGGATVGVQISRRGTTCSEAGSYGI